MSSGEKEGDKHPGACPREKAESTLGDRFARLLSYHSGLPAFGFRSKEEMEKERERKIQAMAARIEEEIKEKGLPRVLAEMQYEIDGVRALSMSRRGQFIVG